MSKSTRDLFPETLLVDIADGHTFTTSRKVAEHFGKRHSHVLRTIHDLLSDLTGEPVIESKNGFNDAGLKMEPRIGSNLSRSIEPNFGPNETAEFVEAARGFTLCEYTDPRGRTLPLYQLTRNAFSLLANRFTGKKALLWQVRFNNAFEQMEAALQARTSRFAQALDQLRPCLRPVVEATEAGLPRAAIAAPLGKSAASITYHRRSARRLGLLN